MRLQNLLLVFIVFNIFAFRAQAEENFDNEFVIWPMASIQAPIYKDKVSVYGYIQPTITNDLQDIAPWVFRGALIYSPNKNLDFWAGYDRHASFTVRPRALEDRLWQQVTYDHKIKNLTFDHRLRLEERFLRDSQNPLLRTRYRLRLTHTISKNKKWYVAASNELHLNLNSVSSQRRSGFSENRIYAGIGRKMNSFLTLEAGYQLAIINSAASRPDLLRHCFVTSLVINIPSKKYKLKEAVPQGSQ